MRRRLLLVCLVLFWAGPAAAGGLLDRFFEEVKTYRARFEQVVLDESNNPVQSSAGTVWIARPGKFRWDYSEPYEQQIVGDGEKVWIYDVALEQVTVRPQSEALGDTPAALLAGKGARLEDAFVIEEPRTEDGIDWVQMKPRKPDAGFETIRLGFEQGRLRRLDLRDALGQMTRIRFEDGRENLRIEPGKFRFAPPPGVDVIGTQ